MNIDELVIPFRLLLGISDSFSPLDGFRDYCKKHGVIDNVRRGFRGVRLLGKEGVVSSTTSTTYPGEPTERLNEEELCSITWTKAFLSKDNESATLVPYLGLNHNPMSVTIKADAPVCLVFWEREPEIDPDQEPF